ncbi:hypothetical protein HY797_01690 [Candidatus Falkowbacteria bacterium]|nr:hypothetical protein [Candidatus Falkowbacteria bacterium]
MPIFKNLIIYIIIAVVFTGIGYFFSQPIAQSISLRGNNSAVAPGAGQDTFAAGMQAAYDRLISRGQAAIVARGWGFRESKVIGGAIKEIIQGEIILAVNPVNPLSDPTMDERIIKISDQTKIYRQIKKTAEETKADSEAFNKDMEEFSRKVKEQKAGEPIEPPQPPDPLGKTEIKISDLKIGDQITVTAKNDIHAAKEFLAEEIMAQFTGQAE